MQKRFRNRAGFCWVELMICVAIISILAAISIPTFSRQLAISKRAEAFSFLQFVHNSEISLYASTDTFAAYYRDLELEDDLAKLKFYRTPQSMDPCPGGVEICVITKSGIHKGYAAVLIADLDGKSNGSEWNDDVMVVSYQSGFNVTEDGGRAFVFNDDFWIPNL